MDRKENSIFLLKNVIGNRRAVKTPDIIELQNIASTVSQTEDVVVTHPDSSSSEVKIPGKFPFAISYEIRTRKNSHHKMGMNRENLFCIPRYKTKQRAYK